MPLFDTMPARRRSVSAEEPKTRAVGEGTYALVHLRRNYSSNLKGNSLNSFICGNQENPNGGDRMERERGYDVYCRAYRDDASVIERLICTGRARQRRTPEYSLLVR